MFVSTPVFLAKYPPENSPDLEGQQSGVDTIASVNVTPFLPKSSVVFGIAHMVSYRWSSVSITTILKGFPEDFVVEKEKENTTMKRPRIINRNF